MSEILTLAEAAERSRLSLATIKRAVASASDRLPSYVIGRRRFVKAAELERWFDAHRDTRGAGKAAAAILDRVR